MIKVLYMFIINIIVLLYAIITSNLLLGLYVLLNIYILIEYGKLYNEKAKNM
mgnify:CR=1 FL=1